MGMFDKDKEMGLILTTWIGKGDEFIVWGAEIVRDDFPTDLGPATQSKLYVSRLTDPGNRYEVTTLASAVAAKVREAEATDFPAVVFWTQVQSRFNADALVLQFVKSYDRGGARQEAAATGERTPKDGPKP